MYKVLATEITIARKTRSDEEKGKYPASSKNHDCKILIYRGKKVQKSTT